MASKIQTVKGTREFYPEQMFARNFIYEKVRVASQMFGYQEWDGPFIEPLELYAAKSGEELVKKQSFTFEDRGGESVALRPELTPSLARMIAAKQGELNFPVALVVVRSVLEIRVATARTLARILSVEY
jgi:histidyl-tRNA synthetase